MTRNDGSDGFLPLSKDTILPEPALHAPGLQNFYERV